MSKRYTSVSNLNGRFRWFLMSFLPAFLLLLSSGPRIWAQTTITTTGADYTASNSGGSPGAITFAIQNTNTNGIILTNVSSYLYSSDAASVFTLWYHPTQLTGAPNISTANGWIQIATSSSAVAPPSTNGIASVLTGLNFVIPSSTTYRFALTSASSTIHYSGSAGAPASPNVFTSGGVSLLVSDNTTSPGYAGTTPTPANTPRAFTGSITFIPAVACTGTPTTGTIVKNPINPCPGQQVQLSLSGATVGTGITYQWQQYNTATSSWVSVTGGTGGTTSAYTTPSISGSTQYRVIVSCGAASATSASITVASNNVTLPYVEDFESITANDQLPNCMTATNLGTYTRTYTINQANYNQINHTSGGSKFGSFRYGANDWFFTPALSLVAGKTYQFRYWYITDGLSGWTSLNAKVGTTPTAAGMTTTLGTIASPINTSYQEAVYTYNCTVSGDYYFGINGVGNSSPWYMSIDDMSLIELVPCSGTPTTGTIVATPANICLGNTTKLSIPNSTIASGLTYQWQNNTGSGWNNITGATSNTYTTPVVNASIDYQVIVSCNNGGSSTSAPFTVAPYAPTLPYVEDFESITSANQLPHCMTSTSLANYTYTDITSGSYNRINHTPGGSKYGYFRYGANDYFFTPALPFTANTRYLIKYWYTADGASGWLTLSTKVGTTATAAGMTTTVGTRTNITNTNYIQAIDTFTPTVSGNYYVGIYANGNSTPWYLSIDDIEVVPFPPCNGAPTTGNLVANPAVPCVGDSIILTAPGATYAADLTFRWEYNDGTGWQSRGTNTQRTYIDFPSGSTQYRVTIKCLNTNDSTTSAVLTVNPLAPTLPYFEDFESITANNQLPPCMKATALGTINLTYIANQGVSRKNHTPGAGKSKYGSFKYNSTTEQYFFTPGLAMQGGITYKISYWYVTDGQGGNNGNVVSTRTTIGTTPTVAGVTATLGQVINPPDTNYRQAVYYYTPAQNGTYFVGFGNIATTTSGYFTIDDIGVEALPPCVGKPTAGTVVSNTPVSCPGAQVELSAVGSTAASYLSYRWLQGAGSAGGVNNMPTYLTPPLTTATLSYRLVLTCASSVTGVQSDTTAPFVITPYTVTVPYLETFESITRNNEVPTCFTMTDLATGTYTYASGGPGANHTPGGAKYATFMGASVSEWMFTPMMNLQAGKTYKFNFWYRTSSSTPHPILQATVGSGPSAPQVLSLLNAVSNAGTTTYQEFIALYTPTTTGDYSFGINTVTTGNGSAAMSIDDIGVVELPPCTGMPTVAVTPAGPLNLCPLDSFTLAAPLPTLSGLRYEWQYSTSPSFTPYFPAGSTTNTIKLAAPAISYYYRLRLICTYTHDTAYSNTVYVHVNVTQYAPLPYLNDLENWVNNCANHDVPSGNNWLQQTRTGNSSWRRNDEGATANWTTPNAGMYSPPARSGLYSARFHSSQAAVTTANGGADEGKLDMYINANSGAGTSPNKMLYFYHISSGAPTNALDVRMSINGPGGPWTTIASFDSAFDWRLRRVPFVSNQPATIIRFAARHTSTTAGNDIGIDSIFVAPPCTAQPVAGIISAASATQICPGDSALVNLNGTSMAGDLRIDWETSITGPGGPWTSRTAGPNGGGYSWNSGQLLQTTWVRARVTCNGSSLEDTSNSLVFTVNVTPAPVYAPLPFTENFENWSDRCALKDIPSANWANVPAFGNTSWRRNDQGATATWSNVLAGQWWPGTPAAAMDSFSARFHNAGATPNGSRGALNLYVNCSGATGAKELRFFVNMTDRTAGNTDSLRIRYSTDGGFTFTRLDSIRRTNGWEQRSYVLPSSSATTIIRFEAVSQSSQKDIGLDYVQVLNPCSGTLAAGTVDSVPKVCAGRSFRLSTTGTSQQGGLTYVWESSSTGQPGSFNPRPNGTTPFLTTRITQPTWFRLGISCGAGGTVVYTPARLVELADTFHCYCQTQPQYPFVTAQYKENIGRVALTTNAGATLMTNGIGTPLNNNPTAINAYTNFQNLTPAPLYRDSTYKLEVQQISYSSNAASQVVAWIDFNRDGVFDTTERIVKMNTSATATPSFSALGSFTVPANAKPGVTGMRVTLQQPGATPPPTPCGTYSGNGETEDYLVELRYTPCSGLASLNGGRAISSDTMICPGYPVTLWDTGYQQEVYGFTRQWQQSTSNGVSWQNIGAPNKDTVDALVVGPTLFRFALICNNGVESYSNVVRVGILPSTACYCPSYADGGPTGDKDSSDIGSMSVNNFVFQVGGPHLLNPVATRKWTNYAAAGGVIELWADSTYDMDIYHIMRGSIHKDAKVTVFIDYNQNLSFDVNPPAGYPSERVLTAYTTANNYYLDNLQLRIPSQQVLPNGVTLMRVILNEDTGPNAASDQGCGTYQSGETEDYYVIFRCPTCPTGVQNPGDDNISMLSLFPNPTTGMAKVSLTTRKAVKEIELTITNMTGQVLKKESFSQPGTQFSTMIDLKEQPRGVYFIEVKADNERIVRKLVVQ